MMMMMFELDSAEKKEKPAEGESRQRYQCKCSCKASQKFLAIKTLMRAVKMEFVIAKIEISMKLKSAKPNKCFFVAAQTIASIAFRD